MRIKSRSKGRSHKCTLLRRLREKTRRVLSLALSLCMIACSMPAIPAYAKPTNEDDEVVEFTLTSEELNEALREALNGDSIDEDTYIFRGLGKEAYEELFYGSSGMAVEVYELFPEFEKNKDGDLSLKVFFRMNADRALDSIEFSGDEEFIFLLLNNKDEEQKARVYLDDYETGLICVAPKSEVVLDEEDEAELENMPEPEDEAEAEIVISPDLDEIPVMGTPEAGGAGGAADLSGSFNVEVTVEPEETDLTTEDIFEGYWSEDDGYEYVPGSSDGYDDPEATDEGSGDSGFSDGYDEPGNFDGSGDSDDFGTSDDSDDPDDSGSSDDHSGPSDSGSSTDSDSPNDPGSTDDSGTPGDTGSTDDSGGTGDTGSPDDSGSTGNSGSSDNSADSGSSEGSSDTGSDNSDSHDSYSSDSSDGSSDSGIKVSLSNHRVGLLGEPLDEIVIEPEPAEVGEETYIDTEVTLSPDDDHSGKDDHFATIEIVPDVASSSDAIEEEEDSSVKVYTELEGDTYDTVIVVSKNKVSSCAAFAVKAEDFLNGFYEENSLFYEGEDYTVKVTYSEKAALPADVNLNVTEYDKDSETYRDRLMEAAELYGWDAGALKDELCALEDGGSGDEQEEDPDYESSFIDKVRLFDISLYADDAVVEPVAEVDVEFTFSDQDEEAVYRVIHFSDESEEVETESSYENDAHIVSFRVAEFSDFMVVNNAIMTLATGDSYISEFSVTAQVDGTAPWDGNNDPGNDSDDKNGIVRTFDYVNYTLHYTTALSVETVPVPSGNVCLEVTLPCGPEIASFNMNTLNWMTEPLVTYYKSESDDTGTTEYTNGMTVYKQVLTGYRILGSGDLAIPGTGTLSVGIYIGAAKNGTTLTPKFIAWMDGNADEDKLEAANEQTLTISAAQKYNIGIRQSSEMNIAGTYDLTSGNSDASKDTISGNTSLRGRMEGYGITVMLQNDSVDKGLKGLEFPTGTITFDLTLSEQAGRNASGTDLSSTAGYTPVIWDYDANLRKTAANGGSVGQWGRTWVYTNSANMDCAYGAAPFNKLGCHTYSTIYDSCYDGGNWHMEQDSSNPLVYHVTISDYTIDYKDYNFPTANNTWYARTEEGTVYTANQACLSAGTTQMVLQFPEDDADITENTYIYYKMVANHFAVDGEGYEVEASYAGSYQLVPQGSIQCGVNFTDDSATSRAAIGHQLGSGYMEGDAYSFIGSNVRLWGYLSTTTDELVKTNATLIKFDADAFEINRSDSYNASGRYAHGSGSGAVNSFTRYFAGRKGNWESEQVMSDTLINSTDLYYYEDLDELEADGYTCVGVLYIADVANINSSSQSQGVIGLTIKNDPALIGNVYAACNDAWASFSSLEELKNGPETDGESDGEPGDITDALTQGYAATYALGDPVNDDHTINTEWARNGYDLYKAYCSLDAYKTMKTTIESANNGDYWYHKTEYDSTGNITGGHNVGYYGGTSLLICGEKSTVEIKADQSVYDMDSNQRTALITVTPAVTVEGNASSGTGDKDTTTTTATVRVTLPYDLTYEDGTAYWGDTAITPEVTVNADGTSVLTFVLEDVTLGETLDALTFNCTIGHAGSVDDVYNNEGISLNATIESTNDHRAKEESFGNSSTTSFTVIRLSATSISKEVDHDLIERDGSFTWTLNLCNSADEAILFTKLADVFPFNGDDYGSSFAGSYSVTGIEVDFSEAEVSYADDNEEMQFYVSNSYKQSGKKLVEGEAPTDWDDLMEQDVKRSGNVITLSTSGYEDMTAFYCDLGTLEPSETLVIRVSVSTEGNDPEDIYNNLYYVYEPGIGEDSQSVSVQSNLVSTQVVERDISGRTWIDKNENGIQDSSESGLIYATVTLYEFDEESGEPIKDEDGSSTVKDVYGNAINSVTPGDNGYYSFKNLLAGSYYIEFAVSDEYSLTEQDVGDDDTKDSDAVLISDEDGELIAAITDITLPAIDEMANDLLYVSPYHDAGYYFMGETIDISGIKTWDDESDHDGFRPESITIRLFADGTEVNSVTVTEADGWAWVFEGMQKYRTDDSGKISEIVYTVTEDAMDHYTVTETSDSFDVTNVCVPGKTHLNVTKRWDDKNDADKIRPKSITVELYSNGEATGNTLTLNASNNWTGSFTEIDIYDGVTHERIEYTVKETSVEGYTGEITGNATRGYTITNTHVPEGNTSTTSSRHHGSSGGGGGGSTGGSGSVVGGPGESYDSEGDTWDLSPLAETGEGREVLFGISAFAVSAMALIVLIRRRRKI